MKAPLTRTPAGCDRSLHSPGRKQFCYLPRMLPWLAEEQAAPITEHFYSSTSDELISISRCSPVAHSAQQENGANY